MPNLSQNISAILSARSFFHSRLGIVGPNSCWSPPASPASRLAVFLVPAESFPGAACTRGPEPQFLPPESVPSCGSSSQPGGPLGVTSYELIASWSPQRGRHSDTRPRGSALFAPPSCWVAGTGVVISVSTANREGNFPLGLDSCPCDSRSLQDFVGTAVPPFLKASEESLTRGGHSPSPGAAVSQTSGIRILRVAKELHRK